MFRLKFGVPVSDFEISILHGSLSRKQAVHWQEMQITNIFVNEILLTRYREKSNILHMGGLVLQYRQTPNESQLNRHGGLRALSHCAIFSDCDCDSSYGKKWAVQDSMEVFTQCDCHNITNSYLAHYKQKQIAVQPEKTHNVNEPLRRQQRLRLQKDVHFEMVYQLTLRKEKSGWRDNMSFCTTQFCSNHRLHCGSYYKTRKEWTIVQPMISMVTLNLISETASLNTESISLQKWKEGHLKKTWAFTDNLEWNAVKYLRFWIPEARRKPKISKRNQHRLILILDVLWANGKYA